MHAQQQPSNDLYSNIERFINAQDGVEKQEEALQALQALGREGLNSLYVHKKFKVLAKSNLKGTFELYEYGLGRNSYPRIKKTEGHEETETFHKKPISIFQEISDSKNVTKLINQEEIVLKIYQKTRELGDTEWFKYQCTDTYPLRELESKIVEQLRNVAIISEFISSAPPPTPLPEQDHNPKSTFEKLQEIEIYNQITANLHVENATKIKFESFTKKDLLTDDQGKTILHHLLEKNGITDQRKYDIICDLFKYIESNSSENFDLPNFLLAQDNTGKTFLHLAAEHMHEIHFLNLVYGIKEMKGRPNNQKKTLFEWFQSSLISLMSATPILEKTNYIFGKINATKDHKGNKPKEIFKQFTNNDKAEYKNFFDNYSSNVGRYESLSKKFREDILKSLSLEPPEDKSIPQLLLDSFKGYNIKMGLWILIVPPIHLSIVISQVTLSALAAPFLLIGQRMINGILNKSRSLTPGKDQINDTEAKHDHTDTADHQNTANHRQIQQPTTKYKDREPSKTPLTFLKNFFHISRRGSYTLLKEEQGRQNKQTKQTAMFKKSRD